MDLRIATRQDLPAIVAQLIDEDRPLDPAAVDVDDAYVQAFEAVDADQRNELLVLDQGDGTVLGFLQVTYIPGLGRHGAERALFEAVRIRPDRRNEGLGRLMLQRAMARARERGCTLVQLTSRKQRDNAHRFYASLGFVASHDGFKRSL